MINIHSVLMIIAVVTFWLGLFFGAKYLAEQKDNNIKEKIIEQNITKHICSCPSQEQVNVMLIERLDNCIKGK